MPKYYTTIASAERIMELDDLPNEKEINQSDINVSATYKSLKSIEFENISFKYDRDIILDNTSLSIKKGDFVAIHYGTKRFRQIDAFKASFGCI